MSEKGASRKSQLHKAMQKSQTEKSRATKILASQKRILVLILILGLFLGIYYFVNDEKKNAFLVIPERTSFHELLKKPTQTEKLATERKITPGQSHVSGKVQMPSSIKVTALDETPAQMEKSEYTLKAIFWEKTWLRIHIDEDVIREYLFKPGESMTWRAKENFKLRIGNAGGLRLFFDGQALPSLGGHGEVREVTLP